MTVNTFDDHVECDGDKNFRQSRLNTIRQAMRNNLGFLMQLAALTLLPLLIIWQLNFKFELLWMPSLTMAGVVLFWIGHRLREQDR